MQLDQDQYCRLLLAVYPTFVQALPASAQPGKGGDTASLASMSLENHITELRDEIRRIGIVFDEETARQYLDHESLQDAQDALHSILTLFEDLVDLGGVDEGTEEICSHSMAEFRNLVALRNRLSSQGAATCLGFVSYGTEPKRFLRAISEAKKFNRKMAKISSSASHTRSLESSVAARRDSKADSVSLAQALRLAEASRRLFTLLEQGICSAAEAPHQGHLRLSGFRNPEFEMMLSVCDDATKWQQAYIGLADRGARVAALNGLCLELKRSRNLKRPSRLLLGTVGIGKADSRKERIKTHLAPPSTTLGDILRIRGQERASQGVAPCYNLKLNRKRELGVKIAEAVLHLYGSPLLNSNLRGSDSIFILQADTAGNDATPDAYMSFRLGSEPVVDPLGVGTGDGDAPEPSLLVLANILIELEKTYHDTIPNTCSAEDLYESVNSRLVDLEDDIDAIYYDIVDRCVQLYVDSSDLECSKVQTELLKEVVGPLTERYEMLQNLKMPPTLEVIAETRPPPATVGIASCLPERPRGPAQQMMSIAEASEEQPDGGQHILQASFSLSASGPQFLAGIISNSWSWLNKVDQTNELMERIRAKHPTNRKVRIAILDTGCDVDDPCIISLADAEMRLVGHWHDWAGGSPVPVDEDANRHGTSTAALLLRVASHAEVFVGRIAKDSRDLNHAMQNIVDAISYAASTWDVDIVTMSFGFAARIETIENAIAEVISNRRREKRDLIFFAAANNDGLNSWEMFPASDPNVISVRGTNYAGRFEDFNPRPRLQKEGLSAFGTLGLDVPYDCGDRNCTKSGCSMATPILAGIMATIIQYVEHVAKDPGLLTRMRTLDGIQQVMSHLAMLRDRDSRMYVAPWKFFERNDVERIALIQNALADIQERC